MAQRGPAGLVDRGDDDEVLPLREVADGTHHLAGAGGVELGRRGVSTVRWRHRGVSRFQVPNPRKKNRAELTPEVGSSRMRTCLKRRRGGFPPPPKKGRSSSTFSPWPPATPRPPHSRKAHHTTRHANPPLLSATDPPLNGRPDADVRTAVQSEGGEHAVDALADERAGHAGKVEAEGVGDGLADGEDADEGVFLFHKGAGGGGGGARRSGGATERGKCTKKRGGGGG